MPPPRVTSPPITTPNVASSSSASNSSVVQGNRSGSGARSVRQSLFDLGRRNRAPADVQQASSSSSAVLHKLLPNALLKKKNPHLALLMSAARTAATEWNQINKRQLIYPPKEAQQHCERFIQEIVPADFIDTVLKKNGALIPEAESFLKTFAGLRMIKDACNPLHLRLLTVEAHEALTDLQRYNDPELTTICLYLATSVACTDSVNVCLTQIKQALLAYRAKECKSIDEVFVLLRPGFNQRIVEAKAHEVALEEFKRNHRHFMDEDDDYDGASPEFVESREFSESLEYYVQIAAEVSKQVPLVESLKASAYGGDPAFNINTGRLWDISDAVLRTIRAQTRCNDPHFLDYFATQPAFQHALKDLYPASYQREV